MNNCPGECTFEAWYRLEGKTVRVTSRINNDRSDRTLYPARSQEQPAVYTNGPWYKLVSYLGDAPFTGGALTEICTKENGLGWPWEHFWPTEYWTALVDDDNYGLGVYNGQTCLFIGGFAGKMGKGGPKDAPTGYISPLSSEILDHNIVYTYQYALIVGSLDEIRKTAGLIDDPKCRSFFDFTNDRSHFTYENITDKGWGKQTGLEFDFNAEGKLVSPAIYLDKNCGKLLLDAAFTGGEVRGKLTLKHLPRTRNQEIETCSVDFVLAADGTRQLHTIDFSAIACPSIGFSLDFAGDGHAQIFSAQLT
ncbi:MAG: hypothetical protein IJC48_05485 [Clostridia bacterium]|nr:hypothetical protein [Clostridia bacterium]